MLENFRKEFLRCGVVFCIQSLAIAKPVICGVCAYVAECAGDGAARDSGTVDAIVGGARDVGRYCRTPGTGSGGFGRMSPDYIELVTNLMYN